MSKFSDLGFRLKSLKLMSLETADHRKEQLAIYGYLRNILNDEIDYSMIFAVILLFYDQGYAKYFDENIDKDY